jgi:enterochelin esterase-like enzyme
MITAKPVTVRRRQYEPVMFFRQNKRRILFLQPEVLPLTVKDLAVARYGNDRQLRETLQNLLNPRMMQ